MSLAEIEQQALALNDHDRTALVLTLIDTLPAAEIKISDEEATRRDEELESGAVTPLSQDEFVRRVQEARGG